MTEAGWRAKTAQPGAAGSRNYRSLLLAQIPPFTSRQWRVFAITTTAGFFDSYDGALLSLALKQIQQGLGVAEARLGNMLSAIRLGYLTMLLLTPLADVFGRRRLLLYTIIGYTAFTGLSAVAPRERSFVGCQFLARGFSGAEAIISLVILAEEVDAAVRGWAVGLLGALAISGYGLAAIVFAMINVIPFGWRGLYALALAPLAFIIPLRRILPESKRFESESVAGLRPTSVLEPLSALLRVYPERLAMLVAVSFLNAMGASSASFLFPKYLQEAHRWSPGQVSALIVFGGALGVLGSIIGGRLSDHFGRRSTGALFMFLGPVLTIWLYTTRSRSVIPVWIVRLFFDTAAGTIMSAYSAELFPTSHRSAASSALVVAGTTGGALGLFLEGVLYAFSHSHWTAVRYLTGFWMMGPVIMLLFFPETSGRELEVISPA
jgi:putative MFS transporter